jgi:hypothetical protein
MEKWIKERTDITQETKKVYIAYIHTFHKVYGDRDPKSDTINNVKYYLEKLSISSRTKMYNILSKYTGNKEYSKAISPLLRAEEIRQRGNKPVLPFSLSELKTKIPTIEDPSIRIIYMLMTDFPFLPLNNYRNIRIGNHSSQSYISSDWGNIVFNIKTKFGTNVITEYTLPSKYSELKTHFDKNSVLITRSLPALVMAIKKQNKIFGIPRGASIFKTLHVLSKSPNTPKSPKTPKTPNTPNTPNTPKSPKTPNTPKSPKTPNTPKAKPNLRITIPVTPTPKVYVKINKRRAETVRNKKKDILRKHSV